MVADEVLAKKAGVTGRVAGAMRFPTEAEADFFRVRHGLSQFEVAVADGDDAEAQMRRFRMYKK